MTLQQAKDELAMLQEELALAYDNGDTEQAAELERKIDRLQIQIFQLRQS